MAGCRRTKPRLENDTEAFRTAAVLPSTTPRQTHHVVTGDFTLAKARWSPHALRCQVSANTDAGGVPTPSRLLFLLPSTPRTFVSGSPRKHFLLTKNDSLGQEIFVFGKPPTTHSRTHSHPPRRPGRTFLSIAMLYEIRIVQGNYNPDPPSEPALTFLDSHRVA